jgi:type II secretory pathway component PulK
LEFYIRSKMSQSDFILIEPALTVSSSPNQGLINVNTASQTVLNCLPGLNTAQVAALIAYRAGQTANPPTTISWLTASGVLDNPTAMNVGPYVTVRSYQFSADVVSLGRLGRGMRRDLFVIDTASGSPQVIYHRDLGRLGWPLGAALHEQLRFANKT